MKTASDDRPARPSIDKPEQGPNLDVAPFYLSHPRAYTSMNTGVYVRDLGPFSRKLLTSGLWNSWGSSDVSGRESILSRDNKDRRSVEYPVNRDATNLVQLYTLYQVTSILGFLF